MIESWCASVQLDQALQDYNRMREREAAKQEGTDGGRTSRAAASRRKSALPVRLWDGQCTCLVSRLEDHTHMCHKFDDGPCRAQGPLTSRVSVDR